VIRAAIEALRQWYERRQSHRDRASVHELLAIARRAAAQRKGLHIDHVEFLYDKHGLPK
jgi:hypothetical protein